MRGLPVIVMVLWVGCLDTNPMPPPPEPDASIIPIMGHCSYGGYEGSCEDSCNSSSYFCGGFGVCVRGRCHAQCAEAIPRCAPPLQQVIETVGAGMQCYCVPG